MSFLCIHVYPHKSSSVFQYSVLETHDSVFLIKISLQPFLFSSNFIILTLVCKIPSSYKTEQQVHVIWYQSLMLKYKKNLFIRDSTFYILFYFFFYHRSHSIKNYIIFYGNIKTFIPVHTVHVTAGNVSWFCYCDYFYNLDTCSNLF